MDNKVFGAFLVLVFLLFGAVAYEGSQMFIKVSDEIRQLSEQMIKPDEVCYADIYGIAERKLLKMGLEGKSKEDVQKQVNEFLRELRSFSPEKIGCKFLFIKGAIVKGGRDVTPELERYLFSNSDK